ncbi:hypothetical protein BT67DRAFT_435371 [Trichocladium antarcticum]|uniref:T6SS Phospholipase effector Tle1-like catalytic domain-containing protein n=1 Tax=Trichocladium antarcticum TaxID=1450529 RepID=A0AAN6ZCD1_9PEZI|nr:hypothetical protein BT67DRAFT_435371 [Trichocladium antarcticum]
MPGPALTTASQDGSASSQPAGAEQPRKHRKLILCFDGTGNAFTGSNADTNVVKLLNKLDRNDPNQFHYYQTGIGTYDVDATSVDQSWIGNLRSSVEQTMDQGFGTGFDAHVLAGYRFLMRYYDSGDKIYMFGFSRGAFTAKFLARMIHTVGLLCKGNEEMVPFAYRLYQRHLAGEIQEFKGRGKRRNREQSNGGGILGDSERMDAPLTNGAEQASGTPQEEKHHAGLDELSAFSNTFCRKEEVVRRGKVEEHNIKVYFLGMWDCVNSVAVLESKTPIPVAVRGTAHFVRHAVAVDERRVKFKAALLAQDIRATQEDESEDIKEVWFPGCHGDVGGGWPAQANHPLDTRAAHMTLWQRVTNVWTTRKNRSGASKYIDSGPLQMSDIPLAWMVRELELVGEREPAAAVKWRPELMERFKKRSQRKKDQALKGLIHDSLSFGYGTGFFKVLLWKFMEPEFLPAITRWELEGDVWKNVRFPLNGGNTRDIPADAVLHESLLWRLRNDPTYCPPNNHGGRSAPCLKHEGRIPDVEFYNQHEENDGNHQTYQLAKGTSVG